MAQRTHQFAETVREQGLILPNNSHLHRKLLRAGGLSVPASIAVLRSFLQMLNSAPEYFEHVLQFSKSDALLKSNCIIIAPTLRDTHGRRIFFLRPGQWNPDRNSFHEVFGCVYKILSVVSLEPNSQISGCTVIVDATGFGYRHFKSVSLDNIRILALFLQQGFPLWFRKIHFVNASRFFNMFFALLASLLSKEVKENFIFHSSLAGLKEAVSADVLPADLGGNAGKLDNEEIRMAITGFEEYFREVDQLGRDNRGKY
jgi:hypothetical protein